MSVLTRDVILRELESGRLRLEPFSLDQVGAASIDLHLGDELRVPLESSNGPIDVTDDTTPEAFTRVIAFEKPYVLAPGHTVHGITRERLFLPPDLCAWIEGRSRIARLGLTVHVSSGFVQPGVSNHQVLELSNVSGRALALHPGVRICQIVLQRTEGSAVYRGRFADQDAP
ncbi:MAG TPA: dCTP deaminase [Myxococcota bacterium]|nr:dCTP deaminase [Myxococcota bacterium]